MYINTPSQQMTQLISKLTYLLTDVTPRTCKQWRTIRPVVKLKN